MPSGSTTAARPSGFEQAHDQRQEQVGRFLGAEGREIVLDAVFLPAAEGRIGDDDIDALVLAPRNQRPGQRVVVAHEARVLDAVQQHVGDAEHVRKLLLLHRAQAALHRLALLGRADVFLLHVIDGAGEKPAHAAGGIEQDFARMRVDPVDHERGHSARRVIFAGIAGRLQVVEQLLVELAEVPPLVEIVEIDLIDLVDHLPQQLAGFHIVVGVLEHVAHDAAAVAGLGRKLQALQRREQLVVDEIEQSLPGDALRVRRPVAPLEFFGDRRAVAVLGQLRAVQFSEL